MVVVVMMEVVGDDDDDDDNDHDYDHDDDHDHELDSRVALLCCSLPSAKWSFHLALLGGSYQSLVAVALVSIRLPLVGVVVVDGGRGGGGGDGDVAIVAVDLIPNDSFNKF